MSGTDASSRFRKRPSERFALDRVDMGEPCQVADDRADGAAPAAPRRQGVSRRALPAQLARDLPRQLEHLVVEEKETGEPELRDQLELLVQPLSRAPLVPVRACVPLPERALADTSQEHVGRLLTVREVRIAVAELLREVEGQPLCEVVRPGDGRSVAGEAVRHLVRRAEDGFAVAASLPLGAVERRAMADRDEDVLEHCAPRPMCVDVPGRHRLDAEGLCELAQRDVPPRIAAFIRPLELDEEAVAAEGAREAGGGVRIEHTEAVARAAREADEAVRPLLQQSRVESRIEPIDGMRLRQQPAQVRVARRRLDEERDVATALERHLRARDRADTERLRCVGELERAVHPVVIRERKRLVPELRSPDYELFRLRRTVEERIR